MPKFIYLSDNKIQISSTLDTINFTCVSEQLLITGVTVTPSDAPVLWTQTAGSLVTIVNETTVSPTIIFPSEFNTEGGTVVLKISSMGTTSEFLTINVNTRIGSDHNSNTSAIGLSRNTFLAQDSIPIELDYYYADYYEDNTSVVYQTNQNIIQATYKKPIQYTDLKIEKVEWLQNINGLYSTVATTVEPNRGFNYTRNINTKARIYYDLGKNSRKEIVETDILPSDLLQSPAALGVSGFTTNTFCSTNNSTTANITYSGYVFNILETTSSYEDTYVNNSQVASTSALVIEVTKSFYVFNNSISPQEYIEETYDTYGVSSVKTLPSIVITKSSYIFNNSGISIG
jgi:hypothetical protein